MTHLPALLLSVALAIALPWPAVGQEPAAGTGPDSAWTAALQQRARWPRKVHLLHEHTFDILVDGASKGSLKLASGTQVEIRGVDGEMLRVGAGMAVGTVPHASTDLLSLLAAGGTGPPAPSPAARPPYLPMPFGDIKPAGWIREQMLRDITSGNISYLENMRGLGAPIDFSKSRGYGEFEGNFADALIRNAILTNHQPWLDRARAIADFILSQQDEHGYVGKKRPENFRQLADNEGELWSQCCFLRAFLAYYEFTKDRKYLDAAIRSVDCLMSVFGAPGNKYFITEDTMEGGARAHGLMYIDVLEKLRQLTGDAKYAAFAFRLYEDYSTSTNLKNTDHQMASLLDKDTLFLHHGPHAAEHARVVFWLSTETENPDYQQAAANSLRKLRASLSPSGGLVTDDNILEAVGGRPGSGNLRYEYCSITETAHSLLSAYQKFGGAGTAEAAENTVFNAAQAARFPDGKADAYLSKDNQKEAVGSSEGATFRRQYAACHRIACCVYNAGRVMPYYTANMWMKTADGGTLVAAFYGPSVLETTIQGTDLQIVQRTRYPFGDDIELEVNPGRPLQLDLLLRNPSWSAQTTVDCDGAVESREKGFIRVGKTWNRGDTVRIHFTPVIGLHPAGEREFCIRRGALLYALGFAHVKKPTQEWKDGEFANYNTTLAEATDAGKFSEYRLLLPPGAENRETPRAFSHEQNPEASDAYPFDRPYDRIKAKFLYKGSEVEDVLVPIGSTVLRKTTFETGRP